ncbi:MAG: plasmid pRiA4b ORF-3 family protein [Candidatus Nanopelagicales bacterium]|nr:plasmid pRiA4b ORF-3 family protein [Candidatus Nanopelagicales bacterium]MDZ4250745.1 plasmid pRiA4b ORF-3 family protein [Candidatus Nanopelagicales bacterium]
MTGSDDAEAEFLRKFEAAISGMELSDLRQLAGDLTGIGRKAALQRMRPELRRPPLDEVSTYRIRVDLDRADPPIWRRLDLRSDLKLDAVHQVLQVAFDWTDSHLHRFSLGGHAFDRTSQLFLCPYDAEEGEDAEEDGTPATDVRLDETLREPGDVLAYLYDYGDNWELTLRLEEVLPASPDSPSAVAVGGRRTAPPEDSGGGTDLDSIAMVVDDPARFDLDELNQALRGPYFILREHGVDLRLVDLVNFLGHTTVGEDFVQRMLLLVTEPTQPEREEMIAALGAHRWFLSRAKGGGIELTSAGYLKPADVEAAAEIVPAMCDWIGKINRETNAAPLLGFRRSLQSMGLLRKHKGTLQLTRAGAAAERDPQKLWSHLAARLVPNKGGEFESVATLLMLAYAGSSPGTVLPRKLVAAALSDLGWRHPDGSPLEGYELYRLAVLDTLINVTDKRVSLGGRGWVSPAAAALARAALRR